jgi:competence protein ComEC
MGNQVRGYVLGPIDPEFHTDPNTASVIVRVDAGNVRFLFTGDADQEAESIVIDRYGLLLQSTVLKAGHHGSKTSSSLQFMAAVDPKHVVISLAWINRYRHPHTEAVERLRSTGAELHFTSLRGAVWMATDGDSIWEIAY